MKVIRHEHKFMQKIFILLPVMKQRIHEEQSIAINLIDILLLEDIGGHKIG